MYPNLGYASRSAYIVPVETNIHMANQKLLQDLLRQIRLEAGLRQVDLAVRISQPQSFVSKYESGERRLDVLELRQICNATGISLEEFVHRLENLLT